MARKAAADTDKNTKLQVPQAKPVAKRRGKAQNAKVKVCCFADVPVEVFWEIVAYVEPIDLLYLARTTKTFRRALMTRSARKVWQTAIANVTDVPIPNVPEDMSEPAWIHLLFVNVCHVCWKKGVFATHWEFMMRFCPACRKNTECKFPRGTPAELQKHVDCDLGGWNGYILDLLPAFGTENSLQRWLHNLKYPYRPSDYEELKQTLLNAASPEERIQILEERKKMMVNRRWHGWGGMIWANQMRDVKSAEIRQVQDSRRKAIVEKLRALGYGPYLDDMNFEERDKFVDLKGVAQRGPLTERVWTGIKAEVIKYMESIKSDRGSCGPGYNGGIEGWDGVDPLDQSSEMVKKLRGSDPRLALDPKRLRKEYAMWMC